MKIKRSSDLKLNENFYERSDILNIAQELLGKKLCTFIGGKFTAGIIVETEAYVGPEDKASHAYNGRRTNRTEVMFQKGGFGYVYLCYGIHHLFNVVTGHAGIPHATLIRGIEPIDGIDVIMERRAFNDFIPRLSSGPGTLTKALGITKQHSGVSLLEDTIWITDIGTKLSSENIVCSPRVGIDYAEEFINKPWRFRIKDSKWTSPAK